MGAPPSLEASTTTTGTPPGCDAALGFDLDEALSVNPFFVFATTVAAGQCDGTYALHLIAEDLAGNDSSAKTSTDIDMVRIVEVFGAAGAAMESYRIEVDTTPPTPPTSLRFVRIPWGSDGRTPEAVGDLATENLEAADTYYVESVPTATARWSTPESAPK